MFGINKLRQQLEVEIKKTFEIRKELDRQRDEWNGYNEEIKKQVTNLKAGNEELSKKIFELDAKIMPERLMDVLRTLEFNKLKPHRLILNEKELETVKNSRDIIKADNHGLMIYGVRIVKGDAEKRGFVYELENRPRLRAKREIKKSRSRK